MNDLEKLKVEILERFITYEESTEGYSCDLCGEHFTEHLEIEQHLFYDHGEELVEKALKEQFQKIKKKIKELRNPYPLDLLEKKETQEGKFWKFGNKVWNNCKEELLKELNLSSKETFTKEGDNK